VFDAARSAPSVGRHNQHRFLTPSSLGGGGGGGGPKGPKRTGAWPAPKKGEGGPRDTGRGTDVGVAYGSEWERDINWNVVRTQAWESSPFTHGGRCAEASETSGEEREALE